MSRHENPTDGRLVAAARTLLAAAGLGTILLTPPDAMFGGPAPGVGNSRCAGLNAISAQCVASDADTARWLLIAALLLALSGYRPRYTAVVQWWAHYSIWNAAWPDGGDQLAAILSLLLIPHCLADPRRWHWATAPVPAGRWRRNWLTIARIQVAVVYGHSVIMKVARPEWQEGTALYYWFRDPSFGVDGALGPPARAVTEHAAGAAGLTWATLAVEAALALSLFLPARRRLRHVIPAGAMLHVGIAVALGLVSFSTIMLGALLLLATGWPPADPDPDTTPAPDHGADKRGAVPGGAERSAALPDQRPATASFRAARL